MTAGEDVLWKTQFKMRLDRVNKEANHQPKMGIEAEAFQIRNP